MSYNRKNPIIIANMNSVVPLLFVIAVCAAGVIEYPTSDYKDGDGYFFSNGDVRFDTDGDIDQDFIDNYKDTDNTFHLYTNKNPDVPQDLATEDVESLTNSNFDPSKVTVFFAHGWLGNGFDGDSRLITNAYLESDDVNLIQFDWSRMARRNYITAKNGVPKVGRALGAFVMWLTTQGVQYEKVHLVGFSLGGHLVGSAGRSTGGRVQRITALDPAGPLWLLDSNRLAKTDAQYVEVMHTNTFFLGFTDPLGDADFYPNGGSRMPGCILNTCSHNRAIEYMASSLKYDRFEANECDSMRHMNRNRCNGPSYLMGNNDLNKSRSGIFRVNTERRYPFY